MWSSLLRSASLRGPSSALQQQLAGGSLARHQRRLCSTTASTPPTDPTSPSVASVEVPSVEDVIAYAPHIPTRASLFKEYTEQPMSIRRQAWVEDLRTAQGSTPSKLLDLHPSIWSVRPRVDEIEVNVEWQTTYKKVDYTKQLNRREMPRPPPGRPWPQKGMGKARHSTIRSPLWVHGGKSHGPCGLHSRFKMLPTHQRVNGLVHTLAAKFAQDDVRVVDDLELPTDDPDFIEAIVDERNWGISVLFVSALDLFPPNLSAAASAVDHVNLMPVYGLNPHSMLKHKTLVLSEEALTLLESRLLHAMHRPDFEHVRREALNRKYRHIRP